MKDSCRRSWCYCSSVGGCITAIKSNRTISLPKVCLKWMNIPEKMREDAKKWGNILLFAIYLLFLQRKVRKSVVKYTKPNFTA